MICHADDTATIATARAAAERIPSGNARVVLYADGVVNKPHALNVGLLGSIT